MYKHLHSLIVPTSKHLNFTVNNCFAVGGERQVSHPTGGGGGGGRHSRSHRRRGCREPACWRPHGSGEEPVQGKLSPGGTGVSLQDFAHCTFFAMLFVTLRVARRCDTVQPLTE